METLQLQAIEHAHCRRRGISDAAVMEEVGCFVERSKCRLRRQVVCNVGIERQMRQAIVAIERDSVAAVAFANIEFGQVMKAGKQPPADQPVQPRRRVAPRNVNALATLPAAIPFDRDPMGRILASQPEPTRHKPRPDLREPNQANARHSHSADQQRPKRLRQHSAQCLGPHPIIHQDPSIDQSANDGKVHGGARG